MSTIDASGNIHRGTGAPGAGQFAGRVAPRPAGELSASAAASIDALLRRRAALIEEGYAPAAAGLSMGTTPRSTEGIGTWWEEHFRRAEVREGISYLQMPDDYNPRASTGKALSGKRRTHRILYEGADIALRMPSATAIKRFSAENGAQTFDIPVEAEGQAGVAVTGFVRVTQEAPGRWTVDGLGMPPHIAWKVSESVAAVLEARRPSQALRDVGDLLARRRERLARVGAQMNASIDSSWVNGMGYNADAGEMVITLGPRTYGYQVSEQVYRQVKNANSVGSAYNKLVKGSVRVEVDQCGTCKRWFNIERGHTCMRHRPATGTVKPFNERIRARVLASVGE